MKKKNILLFSTLFVLALVFVTACSFGNSKYDYLVLVNKYSKLPDDWEKNVKLVKAKNAWKEDIKIEKKTYEQYKKLQKDLEKDGVTIVLDSVYRSVKEQQELWDEWSKDPDKGIEYVKKYVAVPGYSEHHTGLAVDICIKKNGKLIYENDDMIAEKEIFAKVHKKLAKYGFILRYLKDRDNITGYAYEPWHLRYIDDVKVAKEIMDKDITFEEYLGSVKDLKNNPSAAKYRIEKTLQEQFKNEMYKDKISNSRFNVTKIYTTSEANKEPLKSLKVGKDDIAFDVTYELMPKKGVDYKELIITDGKYDEDLGWAYDISRVGILRKDSKTGKYKVTNFGTGW